MNDLKQNLEKRPPEMESLKYVLEKIKRSVKGFLLVYHSSSLLLNDLLQKLDEDKLLVISDQTDTNRSREELCARLVLFIRTFILPLQREWPTIHPVCNERNTQTFLDKVEELLQAIKAKKQNAQDVFEAFEVERRHLIHLICNNIKFMLQTSWAMRIMKINVDLHKKSSYVQHHEKATIQDVRQIHEVH